MNYRDNNIIVGDFKLKQHCWNLEGIPQCDDHAENLLENNSSNIFINDGQITRLADREDRCDNAIDLALI